MTRPIPTAFLIIAVLAGLCSLALAQNAEWKTLNDEVRSLYQKGQYDRAVVVAKKALEVAEKTGGPTTPT